jgi:tetraacyldisaccharide 4'-kinase
LRNHLYDSGYKPSFRFDVHTVVVGNLTVGGSGKTPMIEYLIRLLKSERKIATLSRGYGRKTKGFRLATNADEATTLGDEPFQIFRKYGHEVSVAVGEERALAVPSILLENPETDAILLDDAFQHRTIQGHLNILLTEFDTPFYNDWLLPTGNLRESGKGANRADVIVVTKCSNELTKEQKDRITEAIQGYAGPRPVFFSKIRYCDPVAFGLQRPITAKVILVSGIARPKPLEHYARLKYEVVRHFDFPDHHVYTRQDVDQITEVAIQQACAIVTTEKDMVRLKRVEFEDALNRNSWFYLPIEMEFHENGSEFDKLVQDKMKAPLN